MGLESWSFSRLTPSSPTFRPWPKPQVPSLEPHALEYGPLLSLSSRILVAALAFRLISAFVGLTANLTIPPFQNQHFTVLSDAHPFWDAFARYDSGWYYNIAEFGYMRGQGAGDKLAFFPLYPMLMRAGGILLGAEREDFYFAGIVISWLAFAGAMVVLYRLARLDLDERGARRALLYAAVFPFAYFFGVVYSESLFFLALVTAAYALRTKRWMLAAVTGAAMTATRVTGVMALPGLAWMAWRAASGRREKIQAAAAVSASLAGIGLYSAYTFSVAGYPFAWYDAITRWNYYPGQNPVAMPLAVLWAVFSRPMDYLAERMAPYDVVNTLAAVLALGVVPLIWRRFGVGYALIVLGGMLLPLSSGQLEGLGRYASVQFPIALALASGGTMTRHATILTVFAVLYTICFALFVTVHPLF